MARGFMSTRMQYRRLLCGLLGSDIERGEIPDDEEAVGAMVRNICFQNAGRYLAL
jgi:glucuronate isomerase